MRSANNVTQIVIGKSTRSRWFEILHGSVVHDLVRQSGNISVHVIAGEDIAGEPIPKQDGAHGRRRPSRSIPVLMLLALVAVAVALGVGEADPALVRRRERRSRLPDGNRRPSRCASACGRRCSPASPRRSAITSSSCRRSTLSRSPTRKCRGVRFLHRRGDHRLQRRGARAHAGRHGDGAGAHHRSRSTPSAASSPASARSTTCCGRPPIRPR